MNRAAFDRSIKCLDPEPGLVWWLDSGNVLPWRETPPLPPGATAEEAWDRMSGWSAATVVAILYTRRLVPMERVAQIVEGVERRYGRPHTPLAATGECEIDRLLSIYWTTMGVLHDVWLEHAVPNAGEGAPAFYSTLGEIVRAAVSWQEIRSALETNLTARGRSIETGEYTNK